MNTNDDINKDILEEGAQEMQEEEVVEQEAEEASAEDVTDGVGDSANDDVVFDDEAEMDTTEVIKRLRAKLKTAVEEKQTYLNGWQKDKAEFLNARKRDEEAKQDFLKFAKMGMIEDLLPVLDSFDMAMGKNGKEGNAQAENWNSVSKEWRVGVEGIYNQILGVLSKNDVSAFGAIGDEFDPNIHHSIGMVKSDKADDEHKVAEVMQKGYKMSGKVIRPALVKVFEV